MAACWRVVHVFQNPRCLYQASLHSLSSLTFTQGRAETLLKRSQLTCLVRIPHACQLMTFAKKRRKFVPRFEEDGVSSEKKVIYENNMNRYHFWGQLVINTLAVPIYGLSVYGIAATWHLQDYSVTSALLTNSAYITLYGILFFGVNGLCRRSIRRMYSNQDATHFSAVVQDWKMMPKTVNFDLSATKRIPPGEVLGSFFGNVSICSRSYLINPTDFLVPKYYNLLMGYELNRASVDLDTIRDIDLKDFLEEASKSLSKSDERAKNAPKTPK